MIDLESIKDPKFIKDLSIKELYELCDQIREFLIQNISVTGGHLSSNLGVVEIIVAMYYVFDVDNDEFLFDVGHQAYVHKILTGRAKEFKTLRQFNGMSGFIKRSESKYDIWESGHSSTSISAASGLMISDESKRPVVVIGDSSISNGIAFEGLNYMGRLKNKAPIIILNDNKMGISKTVGALTETLRRLRGTKLRRTIKSINQKVLPNPIMGFCHACKKAIKRIFRSFNFFEELGFDYYTTTLSLSPYKNSNWINEIGYELENKYGLKYLYSNFKKEEGYRDSIALSEKFGLYRQDYCGCEYSKRERNEAIDRAKEKN